jgi:hypothetical protein
MKQKYFLIVTTTKLHIIINLKIKKKETKFDFGN